MPRFLLLYSHMGYRVAAISTPPFVLPWHLTVLLLEPLSTGTWNSGNHCKRVLCQNLYFSDYSACWTYKLYPDPISGRNKERQFQIRIVDKDDKRMFKIRNQQVGRKNNIGL